MRAQPFPPRWLFERPAQLGPAIPNASRVRRLPVSSPHCNKRARTMFRLIPSMPAVSS